MIRERLRKIQKAL